MIIQYFPPLRPKSKFTNVLEFGKGHKNPPWVRPPNESDKACALRMGISPEEAVRRDNIVFDLWQACPFHVSEPVMAKSVEDRKTYGKLSIRGIFRSYSEFHANETWPSDDVPYIITCDSEHKGTIICTSSFLTKGNHGGTC